MNIGEMLTAGRKALKEEHEKAEVQKLGSLRGGSAGLLTSDGTVYGTCPRLSYLRKIGYQVSPEPYADVLFAAGFGSEDIVARELEMAKVAFKREEDIPVGWTTEAGVKVSGRPDIVLMDENGKPAVGLELKLISSVWTARDVMGHLSPKSDHLIQAGHYSWQLGIPWKLVYANRAYWHINYVKTLASSFQDKECCEHKEGRPFRVVPGYTIFDLQWRDGVLQYAPEGSGEWTSTLITKEAIESYYEAVASLNETSSVPPRPTNRHVNGDKSFRYCDYCPLIGVCNEQENKKLGEWTDHAKLSINDLNKERSL